MFIRSGIDSLDERIGGLRDRGLYVLAGVPGSGRLVALLQFLRAGLDEGPVGLVTAAPPSRVFEESSYWGLGLEEAWKKGDFRLLTLEEDFERRLTSAPEPGEVYEEMGELLGQGAHVHRIAIYPGTPLWDARSGTSFASRFVRWVEDSGSIMLAAVGGNLEDSASPATEWVLESATGILLIEVLPDGLRQISVQRVTPSPDDSSPIALDLIPGQGLVAASVQPRSRAAAGRPDAAGSLLLLNLADVVPPELNAWVNRSYEVELVKDSFRSVELIQEDPSHFGIIIIHLSREDIDSALRACRSLRRLAEVPILLLTEDAIRGTDRARGLEAGASDFMSGPLSVTELASRVEHAIIAGARPLNERAEDQRPETPSEILGIEDFAAQVLERLEDPDRVQFTFVEIRPPGSLGSAEMIQAALIQTIRSDEGDLVGGLPNGLGVVLEGASIKQVPAFLARVRSKLDKRFPDLDWTALAGSSNAAEIRASIAEPVGEVELTPTGT